jgi:predicted helicase
MPPTATATQRALASYYQTLADLHKQGVVNELGLRRAFSALLAELGKAEGWTLVEEQTQLGRNRPDGTLQDQNRFPRGHWEAKDSADDLEAEIRRKVERGYPLRNIIFEDGGRAVLYQNGRRELDVAMADRSQLAALLAQFFGHREPKIDEFQRAVAEFKDRIGDLSRSVEQIVEEQRRQNEKFARAFDAFQDVCRQAIDPNISADVIEKMLVQHLLTERLFRVVFDDIDFTRRNAIAVEIEKVIRALTWNRNAFFRQTDPFYEAIEDAARTIEDYAEKQTFINTVYERFFQGYSKEQADTHGIVYTPQPIVEFMVASVDEVLQREFGTGLADEGVVVLDPATGTGNFVVNILRYIARTNRRDLRRKYQRELFANEVMLLPYYVAALNIEHTYQELTGSYEPFEGLCFADTLDLAESQQLSLFAEENTERIQRQKDAAITVIIGNPPYNVGQRNENDNNKNRKYPVIDKRLAETYVKDSKATLRNQLYDAYVRFFRWASDRLRGEDGIVCYISNNGFLHGHAFDGFRKHLLEDFNSIYHFDFKGNARTTADRRRSEGGNIFDDQIRTGVGITLLIQKRKRVSAPRILYHSVGEYWSSERKREYLLSYSSIYQVPWRELLVDEGNNWLEEGAPSDFSDFLSIGNKQTKQGIPDVYAIFKNYSNGVKTNRDLHVYSFSEKQLKEQALQFNEIYNITVDRARRLPPNVEVDTLIDVSNPVIKWTRDLKGALSRRAYSRYSDQHVRRALYRPFTQKYLYFDEFWNEDRYQQYLFFPTVEQESENLVIVVSDVAYRSPHSTFITNQIYDQHVIASTDVFQSFPYYVYDADGSNRRENITDWALAQFRAAYGEGVVKRDIFDYVYALLHHPTYRERYAENLKRELPRIPLVAAEHFAAFVAAGAALAELHLSYEQAPEYKLKWVENSAVPFSWRVTRMKFSPDKSTLVVNESLRLEGIPAEAFRYRLGNRSALEWVIDQYQVSTDKRSGIVSDPNRPEDEEYIVRLVGRVITVSIETMRIVDGLPALEIARATSDQEASGGGEGGSVQIV